MLRTGLVFLAVTAALPARADVLQVSTNGPMGELPALSKDMKILALPVTTEFANCFDWAVLFVPVGKTTSGDSLLLAHDICQDSPDPSLDYPVSQLNERLAKGKFTAVAWASRHETLQDISVELTGAGVKRTLVVLQAGKAVAKQRFTLKHERVRADIQMFAVVQAKRAYVYVFIPAVGWLAVPLPKGSPRRK